MPDEPQPAPRNPQPASDVRAQLAALPDWALYRLCSPALGLNVTYREAIVWTIERIADDRADPRMPERVAALRAALEAEA